MVARFMTSGTLIPSSAAARANPLSVAELRSGPVPMTEIGSDSSSGTPPSRSASACARARSSAVSGFARNGRSSSTGNRTGPSIPRPFTTSTCKVTVPATSAVWPAISPSPCMACMSPR